MILACDTETTGTDFFHGCRPFLVTMCDGETNYYFEGSVNPYTREVFWEEDTLYEIQELLDKCTILVFHHAQFDMRALESIGIRIEHLWDKVEDTLLASHALCSGDTHNLKDIAVKYLHYWDDDEVELDAAVTSARAIATRKGYSIAKYGHPHFPGLTKNGTKWHKMDMWLAPEECLKYALCDVERTWLLWDAFRYGLSNEGLWGAYKLRKKLLKICYDITTNGLRLNVRKAADRIARLKHKMLLIRKFIERELGITYKFNWNKPAHLIYLLHTHCNIPTSYYTEGGQPSTDKKAMAYYFDQHPSRLLNALKKGKKLETELRYVQSYVNWCDDNGYIHSNLNITGTRETRQSSTAPNQQNISGVLLTLFEPPPGHIWIDIDFSNIELRIWAYAVKNEELITAFQSGLSVHMLIMQVLYPREHKMLLDNPSNLMLQQLYRRVKGGTFALIYGATEAKADETYGYAGATSKIYSRFPGVADYTKSLIKQCEENRIYLQRHAVITLGGYLLDVPTDEPFKACNYYIQGSAGIITTKAMVAIVDNPYFIESLSKLIQQVHDSIKPQVPIHPRMKRTLHAILDSMEECVLDIFGPTPVSYKIVYHPDDKNNPYLLDLLEK